MRILQAGADDVADLARLLWLNHLDDEPFPPAAASFAAELTEWWAPRRDSHLAFVARADSDEIAGMAWVAIVPRVPRPGTLRRVSADIQSVYVIAQHRGHGVGAALVEAASAHALQLGALQVSVHSSPKATPMYERLGFASTPQLLQLTPD